MNNRASRRFWAAYEALPDDIKRLAKKNYALFRRDPAHPSLRFKKVGRFWSARASVLLMRRTTCGTELAGYKD